MLSRPNLNGPKATVAALAVAIVVAAVLLANAVLVFAWAEESRSLRQRAEAVAAQAAAALSTQIRLVRAQGEHLVRQRELQASVAAGTPESLAAAQAGISDDFAAVDSVQVLVLGSLGIAAPDFSPSSLSNNLEIHMVGETLNGRSATPEVFPSGDHWLLVMAFRIPVEGTGGGVVLLRLRLDALLAGFLLPDAPEGQFSLWSTAGSPEGQQIAVAGADAVDEDADVYTARTVLPALRTGFRPSEAFVDASAVSGTATVLPIALGASILLILLYFAALQLRGQLQHDAKRLRDLGFNTRAGALSRPELHFEDLEPVLEGFERQHKELTDYMRKAREDAAPARARRSEESLEIELDGGARGPDGALLVDEVDYSKDAPTEIPGEVFRDYDIRGRSEQFSAALVDMIGRAIATEALESGCNTIVVGADGRESSPALREHLVRGLLGAGIDVIDVGTVATPMLYFACHHMKTGTGVMVTGSHHPANHNGFKIMVGGETLCGERITALRERIEARQFAEGQGSYRVTQIDTDYTRAICDDVLVEKPFRVVIDCGNGAASVVAVELFQQLGCDVVPLFCELDGRFPNHAPDPSVAGNLRQLIAEVTARSADIGIAFDGDADRLGIVTGAGRIVTADRLMMIFARDLLAHQPGADVVFDVKCSRDLANVISSHGGRPIMWRSGHAWIKQKMLETGALLGGEFTGHVCFRDRWFGFDDGIYAAARLLEILSAEGSTMDSQLAGLPQTVSTPELMVPVAESDKFALMERIEEKMAPGGARLTRIDGVRAEFVDGWGLVRASNTSAALGCRFEAESEESLKRIQDVFRDEMRRIAPELMLPF